MVIVAAGGVLGLVLLLLFPQEAAARTPQVHATSRHKRLMGLRIKIIRPLL